jgi:hypothetical protein
VSAHHVERVEHFTEGVTIHLTARQRNYIAFRLLRSLAHAKENRQRIIDKYGPDASPQLTDATIASLNGLAIKLGLTTEGLR